MDSASPTINQLIELLDLKPLPNEGGFFKETYRLAQPQASLKKDKELATAIFYLVTKTSFSHLHRVRWDEVYHFYLGHACELITITEEGEFTLHVMGNGILSGQSPQLVVKAGTWQGTRLKGDGEFALLGCTVSPAFDFEDYEHGDRHLLLGKFPQHREYILKYTSE